MGGGLEGPPAGSSGPALMLSMAEVAAVSGCSSELRQLSASLTGGGPSPGDPGSFRLVLTNEKQTGQSVTAQHNSAHISTMRENAMGRAATCRPSIKLSGLGVMAF